MYEINVSGQRSETMGGIGMQYSLFKEWSSLLSTHLYGWILCFLSLSHLTAF